MKNNRRIILSIIYLVLGVVLNVLSYAGILDQFWSGMGTGLIFVGVLQIVRYVKYKTNVEYKEKVDTALTDERNRFISNKAWAWSSYIFVIICAIATIVLKIMGYDDYSMLTSMCLCVVLILYWIAYMILRRKY